MIALRNPRYADVALPARNKRGFLPRSSADSLQMRGHDRAGDDSNNGAGTSLQWLLCDSDDWTCRPASSWTVVEHFTELYVAGCWNY